MKSFSVPTHRHKHSIVIDTSSGMLAPDRIFVQRTPSGYVCTGLGKEVALLLRAAFNDRGAYFLKSDIAAAQRRGFAIPLVELDDPHLRRLGLAAALTKEYNPDELCDDHGRWTSEGGVAAATAATSDMFGDIGPTVLSALRSLGFRFSAPTAFFGTLFIPTNSSLITTGTVPDRPDISYRYDQDTGTLDLIRDVGGDSKTLFHGRSVGDGIFRDDDGKTLGRNLDGSLALDPDWLPGYASSADGRDQSGAATQTQTDTNQDSPKLCPDPTPEIIEGRSARTLDYQQQISGLPPGLAINLNGVSFDGCRESDGTMLEAKGLGYENFLTESGEWQDWYTGLQRLEQQAADQSIAAGQRTVEWHAADPQVAAALTQLMIRLQLKNIVVIYTPPQNP
jgi:Restriction endonuclease fold toxin 5